MGKVSTWVQFKVLVWKNILLKKRNKRQTVQEVLMPIYFIAILAMTKAFIKQAPFEALTNFPAHALNDTLPPLQGALLVSPNTARIQDVMNRTVNLLQAEYNASLTVQYFDNAEDQVTVYKSNASEVMAGVNFTSNITYSIRMPYNEIAKTDGGSIWHDQGQCRNGDGLDKDSCDANSYLHSGFAAIQLALDTAIMRVMFNKTTTPAMQIHVQMMPKPSFLPDTSYIQIISSIYFVIAYSPFISFLTVNLVSEKEKKIKEGMRIMGLRDLAFWLSWTVVYITIIVVVTGVVVVIAVASKFFVNSNMFLFFLMLMLYGISIIGASFAITPFFNKAQVAGGFASISSMLVSMLYLIVSLTRTYTAAGVSYTIPVWARYILCLLSPVAVALSIDQAIYLDIVHPDGMSFSTLTWGDFPLLGPLLMLLMDSVLYIILALYLDRVIPGEYGPRYSPLFFLQRDFWFPVSKTKGMGADNSVFVDVTGSQLAGDDNVEKVTADVEANVAVCISRLSKEFKGKKETVTAVDGLSLTIYENQITAILGHNGAGKTTTMNILTGLTGPSSGSATVLGMDVSNPNDMEEIRSVTGVCPQHNILFDELTCHEHLQLFAGIRGIADEDKEKEIQEAMDSVGLTEQKDVLSKALSGGQKRKLSVAIAIIGDPKIIFLDEPTAGMDPYSRRHLWSVLKEKKKGRVILLTTHFMDEADILADRKAIMNKGKLRCCGSSLFLKNRFGIGYHLNMVLQPGSDPNEVSQFVGQHVNGQEVNRVHGQELDITLPLSEVNQFAGLFTALEAAMTAGNSSGQLGILNYGVSMTSLEEVFLELEKEISEEDINISDLGRKPSKLSARQLSTESSNTPDDLYKSKSNGAESTHRYHANVEMINGSRTDLVAVEPDIGQLVEGKDLWKQQFKAIIWIRLLQNLRSKGLLFFQLVLPLVFLIIGLVISKNSLSSAQNFNPSPITIFPAYYTAMQGAPPREGTYGPIPSLFVNDSVGNTFSKQIVQNLSTLFTIDQSSISASNLMTISPHYLGVDLTTADYTSQVDELDYTALYNDSAVHAIPAIINLMSNVVFKVEEALAGIVDNSSYLSVTSLPWPDTGKNRPYSQNAFSAVILLAMSFAVIPGGFGVAICRDRQFKGRNQLRASGVPFSIYWGTYFALDAVKFIIPVIVIICVTYIIQVPTLENPGAVVALILLVLTYIPNTVLLSYVISHLFTTYETAQAVQPMLFFFTSFMPYLPVAIIDIQPSLESTATILHIIFCFVFPPYTVFGGLFYVDKVYRVAEFKGTTDNIAFSDYFGTEILIAIFVPLCSTFLNFFFLLMADAKESGVTVRDLIGFRDNSVTDRYLKEKVHEDENEEDVRSEQDKVRQIVDAGITREGPVAVACSLKKEFSKDGDGGCCKKKTQGNTRVAVKNLSFQVERGEVFGLLGPNGAGKSTTLSMMTSDVAPSKGDVLVGGYSIRQQRSDALLAMGYCPQYDPLFENITLQEHLNCYVSTRGLSPHVASDVTNFFKENLKLEEHADKYSKKLSGGTKRKLSFCISMMGRPKIVLLDEPSTGMDPQSKRFLWDTISSSFQGVERGAILTTHYMEEADALCSRIAIMVNGQMKCIGSSQHLKNKYGSGYMLEIKLKGNMADDQDQASMEARMDSLRQYLLQHFPNIICAEVFSERAQFKIPKQDVTSLARAFSVLEEGKHEHNVEEYSLSQSTLEQVFLDFAKKQKEEEEDVDKEEDIPLQSNATRA